MARLSRIKVTREEAWYHVCARVAGWMDWYPLEDPVAREKLQALIKKYLEVFCCEAAAFCLMGNHYHLVLMFQPFKTLSRKELYKRAKLLYQNPEAVLTSEMHWQRFNQRIFDLSELMRSLQSEYARWYNKTYRRRGALWGERFKSVLLGNGETVMDAVLYVELNPVRAGLVEAPEEWKWSSASSRLIGNDEWMIPLDEFVPESDQKKIKSTYKYLLYFRGGLEDTTSRRAISERILRNEAIRGFNHPGIFLRRLQFFTNAGFLGSELQVRTLIDRLRQESYYKRRKNPLVNMLGNAKIYSLRGHRNDTTWITAFETSVDCSSA